MNKEELAAEAQRAVEELIEVSGCRAGQVLVVGCSTSEIVGGKIGTCALKKRRRQFLQAFMLPPKSTGCTLLFSAASI